MTNSQVEEAAKRTELPAPVVLVLAHLDPRALGASLGLLSGGGLFIATMILVARGGENVGANLSLLSQYFIGYGVSPVGALIGALYGAAFGFIIGYALAAIRNYFVHSYLLYIRRRAEQAILSDLLDRLS